VNSLFVRAVFCIVGVTGVALADPPPVSAVILHSLASPTKGTQRYCPKLFFMAPATENWRFSSHSGPQPFSAGRTFRRN
jgi:hypothetical protein